MKTVFVSYDHDDQYAKRDLDSIRLNSNNLVEFRDNSLVKPVYNAFGHVNRRMPSDPASQDVRDTLEKLLTTSSKLIVLIGRDTHSSEWVKWEIDTFRAIKRNPDILFMRVKDDFISGLPSNARNFEIRNWDISELNRWVS